MTEPSSSWWITSMELENFKSYKGVHQVTHFQKFNAVIGPNGAGKSNLMTAIAFVLGVSTRQVTLSEMIYKDLTQEEDNPGNCDLTAVKLILSNLQTDSKTSLQRIYKKSTKQSTWLIDDKAVSLKSYQDYLATLKLAVTSTKPLVFQGDVTHVAQLSPTQLCQFFEHISGSDHYKAEYQKFEDDIRNLSRQYKHLTIQHYRLQTQCDDLSAQVAQVTEYKHTQQQLSVAKLNHRVLLLLMTKRELEADLKQIEQLKADQQQLRLDQMTAMEQVQEVEARLKVCRDRKQVAQQHYDKMSHQKKTLMNQLHTATDLMKSVRTTHQVIQTQCSDALKLELEIKSSIEKAETELAACQRELEELQRPVCELETRIETDFTQSQRDALIELKESSLTLDLNATLQLYQSKFDSDQAECRNVETHLCATRAEHQRLRAREDQLKRDITRDEGKLHELETALSQSSNGLTLIQSKYHDLHQQKNQLEMELRACQTALLQSQLYQSSRQRHQRCRMICAELKLQFPSEILGFASDSCQPTHPSYSVPLKAALAKYTRCLLVRSFSIVQKCIEILKQRRLGVLQFGPLDSFEKIALASDPRLKQQRLQFLINCIKFEPQFKAFYESVLRNTILADTFEQAEKIAYQECKSIPVKVVTLDGVQILPSGDITFDTSAVSKSQENQDKAAEKVPLLTEKLKSVQDQILNSELRKQVRVTLLHTIHMHVFSDGSFGGLNCIVTN